MAFREILQNVVSQVKGGLAGMVMGMDGIAVDSVVVPGCTFDIQVLGVESATVMREMKRISESLRSGNPKEVSFMTDGATVILRTLTEEYFTALVLAPNGNFGKGRFLLRSAVPRLKAEL